jgi:uncharacterized membrane protein YjgN (DUF898 family)
MQDQQQGFGFTGTGEEYFRIWIVNLLLTIVTLGIYSAWAKVRRLQYFSRNTWLNGSSFDYHGTPMAILKGRLLAVGMFAAYNIAVQTVPLLGLAIALLIAAIMPLLLVKSFRFRLSNTSYRGLRFGFFGSVKEAYMKFLALPFMTLFTLYLLGPFTHQRIKAYQHNNSRFGQTPFSFHAGAGGFYKTYFLTFLLFASVAGALFFAGYRLTQGITVPGAGTTNKNEVILMAIGAYALLIVAGLLIVPFFVARLQNLIWNNTSLDAHHFASTISARELTWIILTNFIGIILTLGLFKPFADIRMARYRLAHMALLPGDDLEAFLAGEQQKDGATGTETAEMFDVDIGF